MDRSNLHFCSRCTPAFHLPEGRVEGDPDLLAIVPVGDTGFGTSRLHHPDETPPEAATPLGATR
jgi:hypothetical protein